MPNLRPFPLRQVETWVLTVLVVNGPQCEVDIRVNVIDRFKLDPVMLTIDGMQAALAALVLHGDIFIDDRFWRDHMGHHQAGVDPRTRIRYSLTDKYKRAYNVELGLDSKLGALRGSIPPGR